MCYDRCVLLYISYVKIAFSNKLISPWKEMSHAWQQQQQERRSEARRAECKQTVR